MALITGSSTIDWSGISLAQVDFETDIAKFANRVGQILTEVTNGQYTVVSASPTLIVLDLVSGGRLRLGRSGPSAFSFSFSNTFTGEVLRYAGRTLDNGDDL